MRDMIAFAVVGIVVIAFSYKAWTTRLKRDWVKPWDPEDDN